MEVLMIYSDLSDDIKSADYVLFGLGKEIYSSDDTEIYDNLKKLFASMEHVVAPVSILASKLELNSGRRTVSTSPIIPSGYFSISSAISFCLSLNSLLASGFFCSSAWTGLACGAAFWDTQAESGKSRAEIRAHTKGLLLKLHLNFVILNMGLCQIFKFSEPIFKQGGNFRENVTKPAEIVF